MDCEPRIRGIIRVPIWLEMLSDLKYPGIYGQNRFEIEVTVPRSIQKHVSHDDMVGWISKVSRHAEVEFEKLLDGKKT